MFRYPANGLNWGLVPMNRVSDPSCLRDCGTFYLKAGVYVVVGAVGGTTAPVEAVIAAVSGNPLLVDLQRTFVVSTGSNSGGNNFVGAMTVPDDGSGGSVLGVYQNFTTNPNNAANLGVEEVYASLLFLEQQCQRPPLLFAAEQRILPAPPQLTLRGWNRFYLTGLVGLDNTASPAGSYLVSPNKDTFRVPAGLYLVVGIVASNLYQASCALALAGPDQSFLPPGDLLLQSSSGTTQGDQRFQGVVSVPDDGSGGSTLEILGYPVTRNQFGTQVNTGLSNVYVNVAFVPLDSTVPPCKPFTPLPPFFSVLQSYAPGTPSPVFVNTGGSFGQVPLTTVVGPSPATFGSGPVALLPSIDAGCFRLPPGSWLVLGTTPGSNGRQPTAGALCSVRSRNQIYFDENCVLLRSTNAFGGNMEFVGVVQVPESTLVCLFVSYQNTQSYGAPVSCNLPEIYTQLTFLQANP